MTTWEAKRVPDEREAVDEWLLGLMRKNQRNRAMLAKLEDTLLAFLKDDTKQRLEFPPKSAFQRKVFHRVAVRYGLDHKILDGGGGTGENMRTLVLIKNLHSAAPKTRLSDMDLNSYPLQVGASSSSAADAATSIFRPSQALNYPLSNATERADGSSLCANTKKPALFLRRPSSDSNLCGGQMPRPVAKAGSTLKSVSEEEYKQVRARIFKDEQEEELDASTDAKETKLPGGEVRQAKGPVPGSIGFGRGRGRGAGSRVMEVPPMLPSTKSGEEASGAKKMIGKDTVQEDAQVYSAEVQEANDLNDPDFDRRYSRWAAPHVPIHQPLMTPQAVPYYGMPPYSNFGIHSQAHLAPSDPQQQQQQQHLQQHGPLHRGFPGMLMGHPRQHIADVAQPVNGGWNPHTTSNAPPSSSPGFDIQTMSDFPSLAQANAIGAVVPPTRRSSNNNV